MENNIAIEQFSDTIEDIVNRLREVPEGYKARLYCQGKNGRDFRVGNIQVATSGIVVLSGRDEDGNSMYSVSYFERTQFLIEIYKIMPNEPADERKPIGFSRRDAIIEPE